MARKQSTTEKPASTKPARASKPAATESATEMGVGIKRLAEIVGRNPKSVRASIRRLRGGAQVGQGGRYSWPSEKDADFQELVTKLSKEEASA
jgi:transposase-like protein